MQLTQCPNKEVGVRGVRGIRDHQFVLDLIFGVVS